MWSDLNIRIRSLFRRRRVEEDLEDELRFHVERQLEKYVHSGMSREEAARRIRLEFGNIDHVKEQCRDAQGTTLLTDFAQDVRYGLRVLRRAPGFTAVTVLILALGIGANTAVFSILDAVLLRPLPYKSADRLVAVWQRVPPEKIGMAFDTYRMFEEWSRSSHSFEKLAAATWARDAGALLLWKGQMREVMAVPASVNFFSMLGVPAAQGRTFEASDLRNPCTVVLAHNFWQERLGGEPGWVGRDLTLDGVHCTIAGIMAKDFSFYPKQAELWTLIIPNSKFTQKPWDMPIGAFGLLKPGISRAAAEAELAGIQKRIIHEDPGWAALKTEPSVLDLQWEFTWLTGRSLRRSLIILFAVVVFVLLIACVNVANLLLGRSAERQKELSLRAAIGAGRSRLVRQLLTESALLSLAGAALGTLLAIACVHYIAAKEALQLPPGNPVSVNWHVLMFTIVLALLTSVIFGLVPAWKASQINVHESLKQSSTGASRGATSQKTSRALVVIEMALSVIVLVGAGLLVESMIRLANAPLGYARDHLLSAEIRLPASSYPKAEDGLKFWDRLAMRLKSMPGVQGVAIGTSPTNYFPGTSAATIEGDGARLRTVTAGSPESVDAGFFHVVGIPLLQGREFTDADRTGSLPVAIVNEAFVKEFFPNGSPIGRRIKTGTADAKDPWLTIVGVVGDVSRPTLFMDYSHGSGIYRPLRQEPASLGLAVFVRTAGNFRGLSYNIVRAVADTDSNVPMPTVQTVDESLSSFLAEPRFRSELFSVFAGLALLLAAVGVYGVLSQLVVQRTHEIGIRIALGANRQNVLRLILGEGLKLTLVGVAIGIVGALGLSRLLSGMLYGVGASDPFTFASVSLLLTAVALLACYLPARRATRMNPLRALRCE
jgi:putative ABC transport system permease protein